jgi:hypothetical protein
VTLVWKTGDTAPVMAVQLVGRDGPANLTGIIQVVLHVEGQDDVIPCTVVDALDGIVRPERGDVEPPAGRSVANLAAEFEVTYSSGLVQTFPEKGFTRVQVFRELDPPEQS